MAFLFPPQTLPQVAYLIYRYLMLVPKDHKEDVETLRRLLAPASLRSWQSGAAEEGAEDDPKQDDDAKEQAPVRYAYNALKELGIIHEEGGAVRISESLPEACFRSGADEAAFRRLLRTRILLPELNEDLWSEDGRPSLAGPRDLTRALAWLLAQELYQPIRPWKDSSEFSVQRLQQKQFGQEQKGWLFSNDTRFASFKRWAVYLGFAWPLNARIENSSVDAQFLGDPTEALRDVIPQLLLVRDRDVPLPEFLSELAIALPVVDMGQHRAAVLEHLIPGTLELPPQDALSTSLSHAMLRLQDEGLVMLSNKSDIDKRLLSLGAGGHQPYSHIRLSPEYLQEVSQ